MIFCTKIEKIGKLYCYYTFLFDYLFRNQIKIPIDINFNFTFKTVK